MADREKEQLPVPVMPSRGAKAGVRSDVSRAKDGSYNPVGTGSAWSHNFLNQKPWHPLNFRNQPRLAAVLPLAGALVTIRKYEAEQKAVQDHKAREAAMAEWQAEQERQTTLAFLSPQEAKRQQDRASISFMYQKPPGLEAALIRDRELAEKRKREEAAAAAAAGDGSQQQLQPGGSGAAAAAAGDQARQREQQQEALRQRQQQLDRLREDPFAAILAARSALQHSEKFVLKSVEGAFGGVAPGSENQLLLGGGDGDAEEAQQGAGEMDEAEALLATLDPAERAAVLEALSKKRRRAEKAARLEQAQELLRSAGIDLAAAAAAGGKDGSSRSHKRHRKESSKRSKKHKEPSKHKRHKKHKKSHKHQWARRGSESDSSSSGSGSSDKDRD